MLIAPHISEAKLQTAARELPIVLTHRHSFFESYDTIVSDDDAGAEAVVQHLVSLGHRRIAHIGPARGSPASNVAVRRARSYRKAMERAGLGDMIQVQDIDHYTVDFGFRAAQALFGQPILPTAIFAGADNVAMGVMQAAYEAGLKIPEDLSLVGYDNTETAALGPISLTSVDQSPAAIGTKAAELLLTRIDGRKRPERHTFAPELVVRRTSAPPR